MALFLIWGWIAIIALDQPWSLIESDLIRFVGINVVYSCKTASERLRIYTREAIS